MALEKIKGLEGRGAWRGHRAVDGTKDRRGDRSLENAQSIVEVEEDRRGNIVMKRLQMAVEETEGRREDRG